MPPDDDGAAAADLADLRQRVEALERALVGRGGAAAGGTALPGVPGSAVVPTDPALPEDRFWALTGLQASLGPGAGGVLFTGHVPLVGGGLAVWQEGRDVDDLLDADAEQLAASLAALASPVRLRLLRAVLRGTTGSGELAADDGFGTTGQVHHHLRQLVAAGWLRPTTRGHYAVPVERVVPLLAALSAAAR